MASVEKTERNVFIFEWKIENFVHFKKISSPLFFVHSIEKGFTLELFCSHQEFEEPMISLYLQLVHDYGDSIELDFELSCLALDGSALVSNEKLKYRLQEGKRRGIWNFMPLHDVITKRRNIFLPQETLTLQCKIWKNDGDMSESVICFARSRVGIEKSSFVWPIEGISGYKCDGTTPYSVRKASNGDPILAMNFHASSNGEHFELELTPPENVFEIPVGKDTGSKMGFYDLKLSFINDSGKEELDQEVKRLEYNKMSSIQLLITEELMKEENGYMVDDILSLKCQFTFYEGIVSEEIERTVYGSGEIPDLRDTPAVVLKHDGMNTPISSLKDIQKLLYDTQMFCDVKLRSGTEFIPAHKSILSARSLVFHSTFEDSKDDTVVVSDVATEALRQLIRFIYTDTVKDIQLEDIYQLFVAAEKYKVSALKKKCSLMLAGSLTINNLCEIRHFADKHEDEDLKSAIEEFIFEHEKEVTDSVVSKILEKRNTVSSRRNL